ncbi:MAG TPA: DUF6364 family protein [Chitinophagales bacterium]|nr:DUF6364 family protein [Chitinophagales bacterium]
MAIKVTLSLDEDVIQKAKRYSRKKGISLSKMVEDHFRSVTQKRKKRKSVVDQLSGILNEKKLKTLNDPRINYYLERHYINEQVAG